MNLSVSDKLNENEMLKEGTDDFTNDGVTVRLGDLVEEISKLLGIDSQDIEVKMNLSSLERDDNQFIAEWMNTEEEKLDTTNSGVLDITLSNNSKSPMCGFIYSGLHVPFYIDGTLVDFKTMLASMSLEEENTDDVILAIPFKYLTILNNGDWYSSYIFTQAVINCQSKNSTYMRTRVK